MLQGFLGKHGGVNTTQDHFGSQGPVTIGYLIRAQGGRGHGGYADEIGDLGEIYVLHVLVEEPYFDLRRSVGREIHEPERSEESLVKKICFPFFTWGYQMQIQESIFSLFQPRIG
jgi:hypothetical protein